MQLLLFAQIITRVNIVSVVHRLCHEENASTTTCAKYRQDWIKIKEPVCAKIIISLNIRREDVVENLLLP